jgi:tRNA N6-adenosine threonylcarbamoyltransferase
MRILGIETSCDETSAAVLNGNEVLSNVISSQAVHLQFGGVVPELASRAHVRKIVPIVNDAMENADIDFTGIAGIAVTYGPGLVGALLVGINYAKGLAMVLKKPFVGINHIEGHIYSNFLERSDFSPPFMCLVVSGGHTMIVLVKDHLDYRVIGKTRDDAVGEAFDKVAKLLDLPYPGGPEIDQLAKNGDTSYVEFPRALMKEKSLDFSYSGLKTAVLNYLKGISERELKDNLSSICASFQRAAVEVLVHKTIEAARTYQVRQIGVCGGVAANSLLRDLMNDEAEKFHLDVNFPALRYCTDNAAMIARAGLERLRHGHSSALDLNAYPALQLGR